MMAGPMPILHRPTILVVLASLLVTTAACGSGSKRRTAAPITTTSTSLAPTTTTAPGPAPSPAPKTSLNFAPCASDEGFQCATAEVPLDYAHPNGPTQAVRVTRLAASGPVNQRIGSLFVNPGGPGAGALSFAHDLRKVL